MPYGVDGDCVDVTYASRRTGPPTLPAHPWLALAVVLSLVGCPVAAGLIGAFEGAGGDGCTRAASTRARVGSGLNGAIEMYRLHVGAYPTGLADLLIAPAPDAMAPVARAVLEGR